MSIPLNWPTIQNKATWEITAPMLLIAYAMATITLVASFGPLAGIAVALSPILVVGALMNRRFLTAYRNSHTTFSTVTVEVRAHERTYHIMENFDRELLGVRDDVVRFLDEAGGVTPVATRIEQRDCSEVSVFDNRDRKHAEITVHVGYDKETVQPERIRENLSKAVRDDDRVERLKRVGLGVPTTDQRDRVSLTQNDYEQLGSAVDERTGLSEEDLERLREATEETETN